MIPELDRDTRKALFCFFIIAGLVAFARIITAKQDDSSVLRREIDQGKKDIAAYHAIQRVQEDIWCVEAAKAGK